MEEGFFQTGEIRHFEYASVFCFVKSGHCFPGFLPKMFCRLLAADAWFLPKIYFLCDIMKRISAVSQIIINLFRRILYLWKY
jgi:hypothetical protein